MLQMRASSMTLPKKEQCRRTTFALDECHIPPIQIYRSPIRVIYHSMVVCVGTKNKQVIVHISIPPGFHATRVLVRIYLSNES